MKLLLSLCLVLLMSSCCDLTGADAGSHEEESTTESTTEYYDDYPTETPTPDYDYNSTFDYYYVTGQYHPEDTNKDTNEDANKDTKTDRSTAAGIGPFSPLLLLGLAVHHIWD